MAKNYAFCTCCGAVHPISEMVKTAMPNRGGRNAYMCGQCAKINRSYHATNTKNQGTAKANKVFTGTEFETSYTDDFARNVMFEFGFIPTHDCSLESDSYDNRYMGGWSNDGTTCEYVSGIISGLNMPSKWAVTFEKLINDGHMKVNSSCGTHFHVSIDSMRNANGEQIYMNYIRRFYHSLFVPMCNAMRDNAAATEKLFGRYFDYHYCLAIDTNTDVSDRYNFINVTNDSNIEFRLNKFKNAKQYQNLMKFEVEVVKCVITNFCEHFNDSEIDSRRYPNMTAYRKHKAAVTANKLVKLFEKYSANI